MGRWYCAYKQAALRALGQPLDFWNHVFKV
jgi:hypothetical protein